MLLNQNTKNQTLLMNKYTYLVRIRPSLWRRVLSPVQNDDSCRPVNIRSFSFRFDFAYQLHVLCQEPTIKLKLKFTVKQKCIAMFDDTMTVKLRLREAWSTPLLHELFKMLFTRISPNTGLDNYSDSLFVFLI